MRFTAIVSIRIGQPLGTRGAILWSQPHDTELEVEAKNSAEADDIAKDAILNYMEPKGTKRLIEKIVIKRLD